MKWRVFLLKEWLCLALYIVFKGSKCAHIFCFTLSTIFFPLKQASNIEKNKITTENKTYNLSELIKCQQIKKYILTDK